MKLLEYEAKRILKDANIPVPNGVVISNRTSIQVELPVVLKSQVPTGGRGKAGGIRVIDKQENLPAVVDDLFDLSIKGHRPSTLLAEDLIAIEREFYLSVIIDRDSASIKLMAHNNGGIEVEENNLSSFFKSTLTAQNSESVGEVLAEYYNLPDKSFVLQDMVKNLYGAFIKNDANLIEINPLILTQAGTLIAGDCKIVLDDAAAFRHHDWDFEAESIETNFVELDRNGNIATVANGAGLAMATVDAVASAGLTPANFLDIGGGANEASVYEAFEKIMTYPNIKAIVINIFAGITRCDEVAKAIIAASERLDSLPPLYIRLSGTNYEAAADILKQNNIALLPTLEACLQTAKGSLK